MSNTTRLVTRVLQVVMVGVIAGGVPSTLSAKVEILEELRLCAAVDENTLRLACYDKLSDFREPAAAGDNDRVAQPPDDIRPESPPPKKNDKGTSTSFVARIMKCTKGTVDKKYIFYLDSGQVWKQVSDRRLYFKECNVVVTISKDFFGYKMQREGEKTKFRVSRVR